MALCLLFCLFLANYNTKQSRPHKMWDSPLRGAGAWGSLHQVEGCPGVCQRESAVYSVFAFPSLSGAFASYCTWTHIRLDPGTKQEQPDNEYSDTEMAMCTQKSFEKVMMIWRWHRLCLIIKLEISIMLLDKKKAVPWCWDPSLI